MKTNEAFEALRQVAHKAVGQDPADSRLNSVFMGAQKTFAEMGAEPGYIWLGGAVAALVAVAKDAESGKELDIAFGVFSNALYKDTETPCQSK